MTSTKLVLSDKNTIRITKRYNGSVINTYDFEKPNLMKTGYEIPTAKQ
jgi:hypothetical protein